MHLYIGIDVGAVALKAAVLGRPEDRALLARLVDTGEYSWLAAPHPILLSRYHRTLGDPVAVAERLLATLRKTFPDLPAARILATGSAGRLLETCCGIPRVNAFQALATAIALLAPETRTVFEMGGESSCYVRLRGDADGGRSEILEYERNGECAAGTGAFIDQQASRLGYPIDDVGRIACAATRAPRIAGRCSVFAKSDMIHAQQKGADPPQILRGLCDAVARNFKGSITKGKPVVPPVAFLGGVAWNAGVVQALRELYRLGPEELCVPDGAAWYGAVGAALLCRPKEPSHRMVASSGAFRPIASPPSSDDPASGPPVRPLALDNVLLLRDRAQPASPPPPGMATEVWLGIDVGSISTNFAIVNDAGELVHELYVRTQGRPIEVVREGLRRIGSLFGDRIRVRGVGTTGSGRELIGELVGADTITDEITAHKTGAMHVSRRGAGEPVDTIFEIGGQDAKFIAIQNGIVVDFAMNEACAAGTGSFLEEQAERLGVRIADEFSRLAFQSRHPARLGERCTVFMEQDLTGWQQRGARKEDLVAGLAYSVALNYLHRVVRGRPLGRVIYFQGGTAYNDAVAAAFAGLLGRRIVVPPHNGVLGAIGMALLAQEKVVGTGRSTAFRGLDLGAVRYTLREFACRGCSNVCDMQEFSVAGTKTYWGDKCGDRYRTWGRAERPASLPDLMALRRDRWLDRYQGPVNGGPRIGIPRAMFAYDRFPFWRTLLEQLGCGVVLSEETNRAIGQDAIDLTVAEPCHPIRVAHGHVKALLDQGVDFVLLPNAMNAEPTPDAVDSQLCPWAQTLPYVIGSAPRLAHARERLLAPTVHFRLGERHLVEDLLPLGRRLGAGPRALRRAVGQAVAAQQAFQSAIQTLGRRALEQLARTGDPAVVLVGRPYNVHDRGINLDIPRKLRDFYGINVLPLDCLPLEQEDIRPINDNMYWHSGRRILAAGALIRRLPRVHLIHITNFKCGPDSYIRHGLGPACGKPFLTLQFDGHGNDAGFLTRCEAYLDSKGMLRWWRKAAA
jgi:predicted CoA-substrate-specific enzyme activase